MQLTTENSFGQDNAGSLRRRLRKPVDLVHLARYTLGDRSLEREVLELFGPQSRLYLKRLRDATCDKSWRDAAHTIKGTARTIGAWRVVQSAEAAEGLQGERLDDGRGTAIEALTSAVEEANLYIRDLLVEA